MEAVGKMAQNRTTGVAADRLQCPASPAATSSPRALSMVVPTYNERTRIAELSRAVFDVFRVATPRWRAGHRRRQLARRHRRRHRRTGRRDRAAAHCRASGWQARARHRGDGGLSRGSCPRRRCHGCRFQPSAVAAAAAVRRAAGGGRRCGGRQPLHPGRRSRELAGWPAPHVEAGLPAASPLTPVRDATSGFFLIRREVVSGAAIAAGGFKICLELLAAQPGARLLPRCPTCSWTAQRARAR